MGNWAIENRKKDEKLVYTILILTLTGKEKEWVGHLCCLPAQRVLNIGKCLGAEMKPWRLRCKLQVQVQMVESENGMLGDWNNMVREWPAAIGCSPSVFMKKSQEFWGIDWRLTRMLASVFLCSSFLWFLHLNGHLKISVISYYV